MFPFPGESPCSPNTTCTLCEEPAVVFPHSQWGEKGLCVCVTLQWLRDRLSLSRAGVPHCGVIPGLCLHFYENWVWPGEDETFEHEQRPVKCWPCSVTPQQVLHTSPLGVPLSPSLADGPKAGRCFLQCWLCWATQLCWECFAWEVLQLSSHSLVMWWPFAEHGQYVQSLVSIHPNLEPKVYNTEVPYFLLPCHFINFVLRFNPTPSIRIKTIPDPRSTLKQVHEWPPSTLVLPLISDSSKHFLIYHTLSFLNPFCP